MKTENQPTISVITLFAKMTKNKGQKRKIVKRNKIMMPLEKKQKRLIAIAKFTSYFLVCSLLFLSINTQEVRAQNVQCCDVQHILYEDGESCYTIKDQGIETLTLEAYRKDEDVLITRFHKDGIPSVNMRKVLYHDYNLVNNNDEVVTIMLELKGEGAEPVEVRCYDQFGYWSFCPCETKLVYPENKKKESVFSGRK
ncbi:MAG: hypothetical protein F6K21_39090 [Symploca sp. SIO2D2]|nr:hypothetical protein [Symploca sp. SIO2D2]